MPLLPLRLNSGLLPGWGLTLATNTNLNTMNSPYTYGTFAFNLPGIWIVNYMFHGASSITTQATVSVTSSASGLLQNIGASTTSFAQTGFAPSAGIGTNTMFAAGSFITINTGTSVTYDTYINVYAGTLNP